MIRFPSSSLRLLGSDAGSMKSFLDCGVEAFTRAFNKIQQHGYHYSLVMHICTIINHTKFPPQYILLELFSDTCVQEGAIMYKLCLRMLSICFFIYTHKCQINFIAYTILIYYTIINNKLWQFPTSVTCWNTWHNYELLCPVFYRTIQLWGDVNCNTCFKTDIQ